VSAPLSREEVNQALEEFKKEEEFPLAEESLVEFLLKKQKVEKEVMLCLCCNVVFDKSTAKAFEASKNSKSFQKVQEANVKEKGKQSISLTASQVQRPYNLSQKKSYVP